MRERLRGDVFFAMLLADVDQYVQAEGEGAYARKLLCNGRVFGCVWFRYPRISLTSKGRNVVHFWGLQSRMLLLYCSGCAILIRVRHDFRT